MYICNAKVITFHDLGTLVQPCAFLWTCGLPCGHMSSPTDVWVALWTCGRPCGCVGGPVDCSRNIPILKRVLGFYNVFI